MASGTSVLTMLGYTSFSPSVGTDGIIPTNCGFKTEANQKPLKIICELGTVHKFQRRGWVAEYRGGGGSPVFNECIWGGSFTFQTINKGGVMNFFGNPNPKISRFNTRRI